MKKGSNFTSAKKQPKLIWKISFRALDNGWIGTTYAGKEIAITDIEMSLDGLESKLISEVQKRKNATITVTIE